MNLEDYFYELAVLNGKKAVILCDRGILSLKFWFINIKIGVMDLKAYMDDEAF